MINRIQVVLVLALFSAINAHAAIEIQHWTTANGAEVYFVEAPEIPMLDVRFVFNAGSARDAAQPGIARLVNGLLTEGAALLDANEFSERLADTGSELSSGALRDMAWMSMRSLVDAQYLEPSLALMSDALSKPRFDAAAVARAKANALVGIEHQKQSPGALANEAFYATVYGEHPYASSLLGTEDSVSALERDGIVAFYQRYYVAKNLTIAIVGAVSRDRAEQIATQLSGGLAPGEPAAALANVSLPSAAMERLIDFPSIQSHVRIGQPGMRRGDPDYFPLLVGNHVLGGNGLVSILFDEVREKRGLSYSVSSHFSPMASLGPFTASLQTDASQQAEALRVLREQLAAFVSQGPSAEALEAAKQNLIGGFPLRIDSSKKIAEYLSMIGFYKLPLDYLETFRSRVAAVTIDAVKEAFTRRIDPEKMVTIIVGRPADDA